jgi:hypothetical protein
VTAPALLATYESDLEAGDDTAREHLNSARMRYYSELETAVIAMEERKRVDSRESRREASTVNTGVDTSATDSRAIYQQVLFGSSWCPQTQNQPPPCGDG